MQQQNAHALVLLHEGFILSVRTEILFEHPQKHDRYLQHFHFQRVMAKGMDGGAGGVGGGGGWMFSR